MDITPQENHKFSQCYAITNPSRSGHVSVCESYSFSYFTRKDGLSTQMTVYGVKMKVCNDFMTIEYK